MGIAIYNVSLLGIYELFLIWFIFKKFHISNISFTFHRLAYIYIKKLQSLLFRYSAHFYINICLLWRKKVKEMVEMKEIRKINHIKNIYSSSKETLDIAKLKWEIKKWSKYLDKEEEKLIAQMNNWTLCYSREK